MVNAADPRSVEGSSPRALGKMIRLCRLVPVAVLIPTLAAAQQPLRLQKPDATFPEPFTMLASMREVRDGRVHVVDRRDRIVMLLDFKTGKAIAVGREGTGPGEFMQPGRLFTVSADTTAIYDGALAPFRGGGTGW